MDAIRQDIGDIDPLRRRYPVRYIMFNNFNIFTKFAKDLAALGVESLNLEDLLRKEDGWITTDDLSKKIRNLTESTLVTPFSELVRFYDENDFQGFFNEIMLIEDIDRPKKRIYIPLIGLQNRFEIFLNSFARIEESAPVWCFSSEEQKTDVFLTKYQYDANTFASNAHICCLNSTRDWLRFWKNQAPQTQIICSSGPIYRRCKNSYPDNIFTFKYIDSAHEYIESFLGINIPIAYNKVENKYWELLLNDIIKTKPSVFKFSLFVLSHFNVHTLNPEDILCLWVKKDFSDYERWLLKHYFLCSTTTEDYPYFKLCLEECEDYNFLDLITKIAERIFYFSEDSSKLKYAQERNTIMCNQHSLFNELVSLDTVTYIKDCLAEINQNNTALAMALCTGVFNFEKVLCAAWFIKHETTGFSLKKLEAKYPDLAKYFSSLRPSTISNDTWYLDYLSAYRLAKLSDEYTDDIKDFMSSKNHDSDSFYQWYHSFEESHNRLAQHLDSKIFKIDKIYWIDALGAEFLPFILAMFDGSHNNYKVIYSEITRCTLPSATTQNSHSNCIKISELDEIAHDKAGYKKYETLIRELKVLHKKISEIVSNNYSGEHTIAIVSDHGLSALSRLCDSKKYENKVEHDGRYIKVSKEGILYHDSDYIVHVNENNGERYKIALTHASLGRKPIHEVHGGCTPEEVLVPYIIITNKRQNINKYTYTLLSKEIEITSPVVSINVMPQPTKVKLNINGKDYQMTRSGSIWSTNIEGIDEGEHTITFTIPDGNSHSDKIKVNGTGFGGNNFLDF